MTGLFFTITQVFTDEAPLHPYLPAAAMLAILDAKGSTRPTHPKSHGWAVDVDEALLESGSSPAPGNAGGIPEIVRIVCFPLILVTTHSGYLISVQWSLPVGPFKLPSFGLR